MFIGIGIGLGALLVQIIVIKLCECLLGYNELIFSFWKYRYNLLKNYIENSILQNKVVISPRWKKFKFKLRCFNALCGKYIDQKLKEKEQSKNKTTIPKEEQEITLEINEMKEYEEEIGIRRRRDSPKTSPGILYIENLQSFIVNSSSFQEKRTSKNSKQIIIAKSTSKNIDENSTSQFRPFSSTSIYHQRKREESIRRAQKLIPKEYKKFNSKLLSPSYNIGITFYNKTPNKNDEVKNSSEIRSIIKSILITLLLCLLSACVLTCLVYMITSMFSKYEYYIVKVWLIPGIIIMIFVRAILYYLVNYAICKISLDYYGKKSEINSCFTRVIFRCFPKYMNIIIRVRFMVTKYFNILKKTKEEEDIKYEIEMQEAIDNEDKESISGEEDEDNDELENQMKEDNDHSNINQNSNNQKLI